MASSASSTCYYHGVPIDDVDYNTLYMTIEFSDDDPFVVLGLPYEASTADARVAYRALSLRVHPDKCPARHLKEDYTKLFQRVVDAIHTLEDGGLVDHEHDGRPMADNHKQLPETEAALHARNAKFKEALKAARASALTAKQEKDAKEAARKEKYERVRARRLGQETNSKDCAIKAKEKALPQAREADKQMRLTCRRDGEGIEKLEQTANRPLCDWEDESDRLDAKEELAKEKARQDKRAAQLEDINHAQGRIVEKESSSRQAKRSELLRGAVIGPKVSFADEIQDRWNSKLLSGDTTGSISLIEEAKRKTNSPARALRKEKAIVQAMDELECPGLTSSGYSYTFAILEQLEQKRLEVEGPGIDKQVEIGLLKIEAPVREEHMWVREEAMLDRPTIGQAWQGRLE